MIVYFKNREEKNSSFTHNKEEFNVYYRSSLFDKKYAEGSISSIFYNSWNIHSINIAKSYLHPNFLSKSKHCKYILLNLCEHSTITMIFENSTRKTILPNKGLFFNSSSNNFKATLLNSQYCILIELKANYFEQGIFHTSLKQTMNTIFKQNENIVFNLSSEIPHLLDSLFHPSKRGLCQFMFLNAKIFEILSVVTDKLEVQSSSFYIHPYQKQMNQVKEIIESKLYIQYSIADLAKIVGLNTSYLKKYFKEVFDETIFEYSSNRRLNYAKELLITSDYPIAVIAEKVGYQQSGHFSYAFKKLMDVTPNQYRKLKKN